MGKKLLFIVLAIAIATMTVPVRAQSSGFSIQVTPSPIVETITPGTTKTVDLKIRNQSNQKESLKITLRSFSIDSDTGEVQLQNDEPKDVTSWVSFANPIFDVAAGEWFTQKITFSVPKDAGFSYSFAILISRANPTKEAGGKTVIEGSVAVFTLLSTNRPDAKRALELVSVTSNNKVYGFLPATFTVQIKNSGNTIVQPAGNIYIQRTEDSSTPLLVVPLNDKGAYILPGVTRSLKTEWSDGFPVYKKLDDSGKTKLVWDWSKLQNFRIGHYVAKVVLVYNDGTRDIPLQTSVGFWVLPWKLIAVFTLLVALVGVGIFTTIKKTVQVARKKQAHHETTDS